MAMRAGHTHKTTLERSLAAARANANVALDSLGDPATVKELLTSIEKSLRSAELQLASGRLSAHPAAATLDQPTLQYCKSVYTEEDEAVANILDDIEAKPPPSPSKRKPHQFLTDAMASESVKQLLDRAGRFDFDALAFHRLPEVAGSTISIVGFHLATHGPNGDLFTTMHDQATFGEVKVFQDAVLRFFKQLDEKYKPEAVYHGSAHAADVMSTSTWFMSSSFLQARTNPLDSFMTLVASAIHDVGHMGRNNMFYTKTMHPLALKYNDKSVLENMHVSTSFQLMHENDECNWFKLLTDAQGYMRKGLISMVLATDPKKHAKHSKEFADLVTEIKEHPDALATTIKGKDRSDTEKQKCLEDKLLVLGSIMHAADVSNPTKPQNMMLAWTNRLLQEFWAQGDEERSLGVPISPLCDREPGMASVPKGQIGFVSFVIEPYFKIIADPIEETKEALDQLALNVAFWTGKNKDGATYKDIFVESI